MIQNDSIPRESSASEPTIPELISELREHLTSRAAFCQICDGALTVHRDFTPDSDYSTERTDVYVTGPCVDDPNQRHERHEDEIIAHADGQMLERYVLEDGVLALCNEIERLRDGLQRMHDDPKSTRYTLRHQAWQLLSGYEVEAIR